jgi:hypothetical protein
MKRLTDAAESFSEGTKKSIERKRTKLRDVMAAIDKVVAEFKAKTWMLTRFRSACKLPQQLLLLEVKLDKSIVSIEQDVQLAGVEQVQLVLSQRQYPAEAVVNAKVEEARQSVEGRGATDEQLQELVLKGGGAVGDVAAAAGLSREAFEEQVDSMKGELQAVGLTVEHIESMVEKYGEQLTGIQQGVDEIKEDTTEMKRMLQQILDAQQSAAAPGSHPPADGDASGGDTEARRLMALGAKMMIEGRLQEGAQQIREAGGQLPAADAQLALANKAVAMAALANPGLAAAEHAAAEKAATAAAEKKAAEKTAAEKKATGAAELVVKEAEEKATAE